MNSTKVLKIETALAELDEVMDLLYELQNTYTETLNYNPAIDRAIEQVRKAQHLIRRL